MIKEARLTRECTTVCKIELDFANNCEKVVHDKHRCPHYGREHFPSNCFLTCWERHFENYSAIIHDPQCPNHRWNNGERHPINDKLHLMVIGYARHGKDTVCELMDGLDFKSSSVACAEIFLFDKLKAKYGYKTFEECFEDRHNHRQEWFDEIAAYNDPDLSRLSREIFARYPIYCGLRNKEELDAAKAAGLVDLTIWVDASERLPPEVGSISVTKADADIIIDNNGTEEELRTKVAQLTKVLNRIRPQ